MEALPRVGRTSRFSGRVLSGDREIGGKKGTELKPSGYIVSVELPIKSVQAERRVAVTVSIVGGSERGGGSGG